MKSVAVLKSISSLVKVPTNKVILASSTFSKQNSKFCRNINTLPDPLPYHWYTGVLPGFSTRTIDVIYNDIIKNTQRKVYELIQGTELQMIESMADIVRLTFKNASYAAIHNNASSNWNHNFLLRSIHPGGKGATKEMEALISLNYGSIDGFKKRLKELSKLYIRNGTGWLWIVDNEGYLDIVHTPNNTSPLVLPGQPTPILPLCLWGHAWYHDFPNRIDEYVDSWYEVINWDFVSEQICKIR